MLTALAEVCDTQAAMNLLGYDSEVSSHGFKYLYVWPAVGYQNKITTGAQLKTSDKPLSSPDDNCNDVHKHQIHDADNVDDTENHEHESELYCREKGNKRTVYIDNAGEAHAICQHELYRHRVANWDMDPVDPGCTHTNAEGMYKTNDQWKKQALIEQQCGLKNFSLLQFGMHITVKKMPAEGKLGKKNTRAFRLNSASPLHKSHYLHLNNKDKIPILAGRTRPFPPSHHKPQRGQAKRRWQARANQFARYMGAILFPWDRNGDCGVHNWDQLQHKVGQLKHSHHKRDNHATKDLFMDAFHLQYLNQVATNIRCKEEVQKGSHEWYSEFAQRFTRESIHAFSRVNESDQHVKLATTIQEIQDLVNQATAAQAIAATTTDAAKANEFLADMKDEMDKLYADSDKKMIATNTNARKQRKYWRDTTSKYNKKWVDNRRDQLHKDEALSEPIRDPKPLGTKRHLPSSAVRKLKEIRKGLEINEDWIRVFDHVTNTWFSGEQLLLFVHGGPGTGKTALAKAIVQAATIFNIEHRFSATSGVAGLLNKGTTIHHLLAQPGELTGSKPNVTKIRLRNGNAGLILIDEVRATNTQYHYIIARLVS